MPKIYDYIRDKMGIIQNEVVWIKIRGKSISLCIVNFSIIANFRYVRKISLSWRNFSIMANFAGIVKI